MTSTSSTFSADRAIRDVELSNGEVIRFQFTEMRRAPTGVHGTVAIGLRTQEGKHILLGYDSFNLARREDRHRLATDAHKALSARSGIGTISYGIEDLKLELNTLCREIPDQWEDQLVKIERVQEEEFEPISFTLKPYVVRDGGTIFFAPPGSGKSYLLQTMAISIATGNGLIWETTQAPVIYINLERSRRSLILRDGAIRKALGIGGPSVLDYVHARGASLRQLTKSLKAYADRNPGAVAILDSLSRAGMGNLNENESANSFIDLMNSVFPTWMAIGHTPRATDSHLYGSQHYDAGADVMVKVTSQNTPGLVGLCLQVVKANDIRKAPPQYLALVFDEDNAPLSGIRYSAESEFPELVPGDQETKSDKIYDYILTQGKATATMVADFLGTARSNISVTLKSDPRFEVVENTPKGMYYGITI
jgi:hypothetical protein